MNEQYVPFFVLLAIAIMASTNAKALSAAIVASVAMVLGYIIWSPYLDYSFAYGVLVVYIISHVLSSFRS